MWKPTNEQLYTLRKYYENELHFHKGFGNARKNKKQWELEYHMIIDLHIPDEFIDNLSQNGDAYRVFRDGCPEKGVGPKPKEYLKAMQFDHIWPIILSKLGKDYDTDGTPLVVKDRMIMIKSTDKLNEEEKRKAEDYNNQRYHYPVGSLYQPTVSKEDNPDSNTSMIVIPTYLSSEPLTNTNNRLSSMQLKTIRTIDLKKLSSYIQNLSNGDQLLFSIDKESDDGYARYLGTDKENIQHWLIVNHRKVIHGDIRHLDAWFTNSNRKEQCFFIKECNIHLLQQYENLGERS